MHDSKYYLSQMNYYNDKMKETTAEKTNYENLYAKLQQLLNKLPEIKFDLRDAENCFKNGGYVDNHETFDKGMLKKIYVNLDDVIGNINQVITKTLKKIILLEKDIENYTYYYKSASTNYRKAQLSEFGALDV